MAVSSAAAAPPGRRIPCSQLRRVFTLTCTKAANWYWLRSRLSRISRTSRAFTTKVLDGWRSPFRICPRLTPLFQAAQEPDQQFALGEGPALINLIGVGGVERDPQEQEPRIIISRLHFCALRKRSSGLKSPSRKRAIYDIRWRVIGAYFSNEKASFENIKLYLHGYNCIMNTIVRTDVFDTWLSGLKDVHGKALIIKRIRSAERGNFGDCASVGASVSEMRINFGPGYRVYFTRVGEVVYLLLCGGTKRGQQRDIARARQLAQLLKQA